MQDGIEDNMVGAYLASRPGLDRNAFLASYAVMGAQRAPGSWASSCGCGGATASRNICVTCHAYGDISTPISHPALAPLRAWFQDNVPAERRLDLSEKAAA